MAANNIRNLPGYTPLKKSGGAAAMPVVPIINSATNTPAHNNNIFETPYAASHAHQSIPTTSKKQPYKTRERLYYRDEQEKSACSTSAASGGGGAASAIDYSGSEDAPPSLSLHQYGALSPERKYSQPIPSAATTATTNTSQQAMAALPTPASKLARDDWITVFGFQSGQLPEILHLFTKLGTVSAKEEGQGNWLHIKYENLWSAQKALAKNGVIVGASMIGVMPARQAIDKVNSASANFMSPVKKKETITQQTAHEYDIDGNPIKMAKCDENDASIFVSNAESRKIAKGLKRSSSSAIDGAKGNEDSPSILASSLGWVFGWK